MKRIKFIFFIAISILVIAGCGEKVDIKNIDINKFAKERKSFNTNILIKSPAPQEYEEETVPDGVKEIKYKSGELELKAWISTPLEEGKKYPAVVFAHGGFAFGSEDWECAEEYARNGFIVMATTVRGENGNPGNFEYFYGEVDDIIAAGNYLKAQSYIDGDKIFLSGHSVGGTLSMLSSMLSSPYKAIASFGGSPEQKSYFFYREERIPFNYKDKTEVKLRSPIENIESIQKPLFIYVGTTDYEYRWNSRKFVRKAKKMRKMCELIEIAGDHFTSLDESIKDSIKRFKNM